MDVRALFDLSGKIALITGSTRGLGCTLAQGLAAAGCTVVVNGRQEQPVDEAVDSLRRTYPHVQGSVFDVREEGAVSAAISDIESRVGPLDILVNNAGIQVRGPLEECTAADWRLLVDVNLTGVFLVSQAAARCMIPRRHGKIINICSVQSELARPTIAPYTAAKGGVRNLTRAMAAEWGKHNLQVNGIAPGYFKTEMTRALHQDPAFDAWLCARTPAGRWGDPEELVGATVFLASDASAYVNGHLLFVDGGLVACV